MWGAESSKLPEREGGAASMAGLNGQLVRLGSGAVVGRRPGRFALRLKAIRVAP
jgi:hypothetical protein